MLFRRGRILIDTASTYMKSFLIVALSALLLGCSTSAPMSVANTASNSDRPMRTGQMQNSIAHTTENQPAQPTNGNSAGKWSASGDPIDTAKFDGVIAEAEKALKAKPSDPAAKTALADAYFDRGFALTEARQYAAALGDYRRALKQVPDHEESQKWIEQIVGIYRMLKKEPPKEGEEPAPLPFKKTA